MIGVEYLLAGASFLAVGLLLSTYLEKMFFSPASFFFVVFFIHAYIDPYYRAGLDPHFNLANLDTIKRIVLYANIMLLLGFTLVSTLVYKKKGVVNNLNQVFGRTSFHLVALFTLALFLFLFIVMLQLGLFSGQRGSLAHDGSYTAAKAITYLFYSLLPALWLSYLVDKHEEQRLARKVFIFALLFLALIYTVATFGRQFVLFIFLTCGMIFHTRIRRVRLKEICLATIALLFVTVFALFRKLRTGFLDLQFSDIVVMYKSGVISGETIIRSLVTAVPGQAVFSNTISLVDQSNNFHYGSTYINSILNAFIPNSFTGDLTYETPARWYAKTYAPEIKNHGFDFSMFAEAYMNFGEYAFIVFLFVGCLCAFLSYLIRTTKSPVILIWGAIMIVNLIIGLRNDSVPFFTRALYFIVPYLVIKYLAGSILRPNKAGAALKMDRRSHG